MSAPAYTAVHTRRTLGGPTYINAVPPPPPPQSAPRKIDWPPAVKEYVQRAFAAHNTIQGIANDEMQAKLKQVISAAAETEQLLYQDWANLPLPQQMIQAERLASMRFLQNNQSNNTTDPRSKDTNKQNSKKRKSGEMDLDTTVSDSLPPWRQANPANVLENRLTYPTDALPKASTSRADKKARKFHEDLILLKDPSKSTELEKRRQRFENGRPSNHPSSMATNPSSITMPDTTNDGPITGTCQDLEKRYFRLTSAPKPETVRPVPVLKETLELLKRKWKAENKYGYICDQFKSMRQDLTVQHVKSEFTVSVYEIHARIALQEGDLGEYNQCQTQLHALYKRKLGGRPNEFLAYRILYFIYTGNRIDMNDLLANLSAVDRQDAAVKHALQIRSALALGNYHRFFKLYLTSPNMGAYLLDMFIVRERLTALATLCKA